LGGIVNTLTGRLQTESKRVSRDIFHGTLTLRLLPFLLQETNNMTRSISALIVAIALPCFVQAQENSVQLKVLVPQDNAKVFFDEKLTTQKGDERTFLSPPLERGYSYRYTITAKWWPNNYTEVIRTKVVNVKPGQSLTVDLRKQDPKNPDNYHIRFVPTPEDVVDAMCTIAKVGPNDVVYDLGCGDGRIVITAVSDFKAKRGVGIDIDPQLVKLSEKFAAEAKVADKLKFRHQDVLTIKDLSDATVVMMYMGEDVNLRLMPILKKTLKPGSRVVSHDFKIGDWKPDAMQIVYDDFGEEHHVFMWTIRKDEK
jgi:uncharacterized protein (TIGR03000 family)